jgi:hypothetical protein
MGGMAAAPALPHSPRNRPPVRSAAPRLTDLAPAGLSGLGGLLGPLADL